MKKKQGFNLRTVCGEHVIVAEGRENIDFSKIISLNDSAAYLWENVDESGFTVDDLTRLLTDEYEVDEKTAHNDASEVAKQWLQAGIIDE